MTNQHRDIERAEKVMDTYLNDLKTIVNIDSGTFTKAGIDRVGAYLQERFQEFGFSTRFDRQEYYGDHLIATHTGKTAGGPRILLIGHIDTVLPEGEVERRPFVLIGMYALHLLIEGQEANYSNVTFLCNSDEEVGSPSSRPLVQDLAQQADAVLVLEPGRARETIVSSRKGCGQYRVEVHGLSAHAGVEPKRGRNAILELSFQVQKMQALNGTIPGATLSVGIVRGGERTNVVPDYAYFDMDVRTSDQGSLKALEAAMRQVTSQNELQGTRITLSGSMLCQPFERNSHNTRLIEVAREAGHELGLKIQDVGSGGASDANTTAAMGIPTLDGLGAGGGLAHNPGEFIELDYLPTRIALVAGLVRRIGK